MSVRSVTSGGVSTPASAPLPSAKPINRLGESLLGGVGRLTARDSHAFRSYPSLDRFLDYSPGYDERYEAPQGSAALMTRSRLWLMRTLPTLEPGYKQEYATIIKPVARDAGDPIQNARQLLTNAEQYLRNKDAISKNGLVSLSLQLKKLIREDQQRRVAGKLKSSENTFRGLLDILEDEACEEFHSFAVTAYQDSPALEMLDRKDVQEHLLGTCEALVRLAVEKILQNTFLNNLRLYFKSSSPLTSPRNDLIITPWEASLLVEVLRELPDGTVLADIEKNLFLGSLDATQLRRDVYGNVLLNASRLMEESKHLLNEYLTSLQKDNQQTIRAIFKFVQDASEEVPPLRQALCQFVTRLMMAHPSGPVLSALLKFQLEMGIGEAEIIGFIQWMDEPAFRHFRLLLASQLSPFIRGGSERCQRLFQEKLAKYGILPTATHLYSLHTLPALRRRLDEVVFGQEMAKEALVRQLERQMKDSAHVPFLYLSGKHGVGKTALIEKLAVELNSTLQLQETATQPETFEGKATSHHLFNLVVIPLDKLATLADVLKFKSRVQSYIMMAYEQSRRAPGRPVLLVFDKVGALIQQADDEQDVEKARYIAQVLLDLHRRKVFNQGQGSRDGILFSNLMLFVTNDRVAVEEELSGPFGDPIFDEEIVGPVGVELREALEAVGSPPMSTLTLTETRSMVDYTLNTLLPMTAAARLLEVDTDEPLAASLARFYYLREAHGHDVLKHLYQHILLPVKKDAWAPGTRLKVSLDPLALKARTEGRGTNKKLVLIEPIGAMPVPVQAMPPLKPEIQLAATLPVASPFGATPPSLSSPSQPAGQAASSATPVASGSQSTASS